MVGEQPLELLAGVLAAAIRVMQQIAASRTVLQKAMMRLRMVLSSRVGALGRGRGHRPSGPSSKRTPGAGADACRVPG
jgi:hypothetical protein